MSNTEIDNVTEQLAKTNVEDAAYELSFAGRGLKMDKEADAEEVVKAISRCETMTALRLEGNTVGVEAAKAIGKTLESHPEFKRALWKDMFTGRLKSEIPQALMFLSGGLMLAKAKLVELDLSDNAFGPVGVEGITELLRSATCYSLKELRLNNNGLGITGGKLLAKSLQECHSKSSTDGTPFQLRVFVCGRNRLENDGAKAIAKVFEALGTLEEVQMPQNGIFHEGITALAEALKRNPNLNHLNLNDNIFSEIGAKAIAKVLPHLQKLEVVNFGDCLVKTEGAKALAESLRNGQSNLKELVLGFNEIQNEGAIKVVESIEKKEHLMKLDLNGNQLGTDGCELLKGMMKAIGKEEAMGSLSEDEGDDEDDDEDDDENEDDEEEEVEEEDENEDDEDEEVEEKDDDKENNGSIIIPIIKCSAEEYLRDPSAGKLLGLGNNRVTLLLDHLSEKEVERYIEAFVKVSSVVKPGNNQLIKAATECTDAILSKCFESANEPNSTSMISNSFLVYLGLIKSEDKTYKPPSDLSGCFVILEEAVRSSYFPMPTKEILRVFLSSRFYKSVEKTGNIKHQLMQTLYKY